MESEHDSDTSSDSGTELKPALEDVLLLNQSWDSNKKQKKRYYGKKSYKNTKAYVAHVKITDEDIEKMIIDDLIGKHFPGYIKYFKNQYQDCLDASLKNAKKSIEARIKANELFTSDKHDAKVHKSIWELYSKSIAFAPVKSKELVLAYESRSNLLLHFKQYEDCIKDIDRALDITEFDLLKVKLLCRKMTCFVAMSKTIIDKSNLWDTLNHHLEKVDNAFKDEKFLKMVEQAKSDSCSEPLKQTEDVKKSSLPTAPLPNKIEMVFNREIRIVANCDMAPGEMILIKRPLVTSINPNKFYAYCSHCLSFMWAGIPCNECSLCMYCSEQCRIEAWKEYHNWECKILPHINFQNINYNNMHLSTRVILKAIHEFGSISKLREKMREVDELRDDSKLHKNLLDSNFLQFYASLYTDINNTLYNLDAVSKLAMKACFLMVYMLQTAEDIFENRTSNSLRGKDLAKDPEIVNFGFILLKILIANNRALKAAGPMYKTSFECDKYANRTDCNPKRHCIRGTFYDIFQGMFEKSCNPNVVRCWTDDGRLVYYCAQPIKKMEKMTIRFDTEFFIRTKATRDTYTFFSIYCQCTACLKDWPVMKELYEKSKQRRSKIDSPEAKLVQKYFEMNKSFPDYVQDKNCVFNDEEYEQLLRDVNDVVKAHGQPSFASSLMIYFLLVAFEKRYGSTTLISHVPANC